MNTLARDILHTLKIVILALALSIGISYLYAAWSPPTATPPSGNTPAPVNVGSVHQARSGSLVVDNIFTARKGFFTDWITIGDFGINPDGTLLLDVEGPVGATEYCDQNGLNCTPAADIGGGGDTDWEIPGDGNIYRSLGSVGIGDTTPDGTLILDVEGDVGAARYCDQNGQNCQTIGQLLGANKSCPSGEYVTGFDSAGALICAAVAGGEPTGPITLVNGVHTSLDCAAAGGNTRVAEPDTYVCEFTASCASGWTRYNNWSTGVSNACTGSGTCGSSCTAPGWAWSNRLNGGTCQYNSGGAYGICSAYNCSGQRVTVGCY